MNNAKVLTILIMVLLTNYITPELWAAPEGKQRDFWRRVSTNEHWGSWADGGGGQTYDSHTLYYYNVPNPTQVGSTLVHVDVEYKYSSVKLYTYSYADFPEYSEVLRKGFDGVSSLYPCIGRTVYRYNYDGLLIYFANINAAGDALIYRQTMAVFLQGFGTDAFYLG